MKKKIILKTAELEAITGYKQQSLNRLAKAGIITKEKNRTWDAVKVIPELIKHKTALATKPLHKEIKKLLTNDPEHRIRTAKASIIEMELLKMQKSVLPADYVHYTMVYFFDDLMKRFEAMPRKLVPKILRGRTTEASIEIMNQEFIKIRELIGSTIDSITIDSESSETGSGGLSFKQTAPGPKRKRTTKSKNKSKRVGRKV